MTCHHCPLDNDRDCVISRSVRGRWIPGDDQRCPCHCHDRDVAHRHTMTHLEMLKRERPVDPIRVTATGVISRLDRACSPGEWHRATVMVGSIVPPWLAPPHVFEIDLRPGDAARVFDMVVGGKRPPKVTITITIEKGGNGDGPTSK